MSAPRVIVQQLRQLFFSIGLEDDQCPVCPVRSDSVGGVDGLTGPIELAERPAEKHRSLTDDAVDERDVIWPVVLLPHRPGRVPSAALFANDDETHRRTD